MAIVGRVAAVPFPFPFAALAGRSGHGLARRLVRISMDRFPFARPLWLV